MSERIHISSNTVNQIYTPQILQDFANCIKIVYASSRPTEFINRDTRLHHGLSIAGFHENTQQSLENIFTFLQSLSIPGLFSNELLFATACQRARVYETHKYTYYHFLRHDFNKISTVKDIQQPLQFLGVERYGFDSILNYKSCLTTFTPAADCVQLALFAPLSGSSSYGEKTEDTIISLNVHCGVEGFYSGALYTAIKKLKDYGVNIHDVKVLIMPFLWYVTVGKDDERYTNWRASYSQFHDQGVPQHINTNEIQSSLNMFGLGDYSNLVMNSLETQKTASDSPIIPMLQYVLSLLQQSGVSLSNIELIPEITNVSESVHTYRGVAKDENGQVLYNQDKLMYYNKDSKPYGSNWLGIIH